MRATQDEAQVPQDFERERDQHLQMIGSENHRSERPTCSNMCLHRRTKATNTKTPHCATPTVLRDDERYHTRSSLVLRMGSLGSTTHEPCARRRRTGTGRRPEDDQRPESSGSQRPACSLRRRAATASPPFVGLVPRNLRLCRLSPCLCHNPNMFKNHAATRFLPVSSLSLARARRRATGGWFSKSRLWPRARIGVLHRIPEARPVSPVASPGAILWFCVPPPAWPRPSSACRLLGP